jgi:plasmid stabilization system protein ParE
MTRPLTIRPEAAAEITEARDWYERRRPGLGDDFVAALAKLLGTVRSNPMAFPAIYGDVHRAILSRFPYAVYYRLDAEAVIVLAVIHARRHPPAL